MSLINNAFINQVMNAWLWRAIFQHIQVEIV